MHKLLITHKDGKEITLKFENLSEEFILRESLKLIEENPEIKTLEVFCFEKKTAFFAPKQAYYSAESDAENGHALYQRADGSIVRISAVVEIGDPTSFAWKDVEDVGIVVRFIKHCWKERGRTRYEKDLINIKEFSLSELSLSPSMKAPEINWEEIKDTVVKWARKAGVTKE